MWRRPRIARPPRASETGAARVLGCCRQAPGWRTRRMPRVLCPGAIFCAEVVPMARSRAKPQRSRSALSSFDVLREQAALIETQKRRLSRLLAMEDDSHDHTPEVRHNIELLMRMCGAHLRVQQELGL